MQLAFWPRIHTKNQNNGKYVDRQCNSVVSRQKNHIRAVKTRVTIVYVQLKFDESQDDYLTQTLVYLTGVELKKNVLLLEKIE